MDAPTTSPAPSPRPAAPPDSVDPKDDRFSDEELALLLRAVLTAVRRDRPLDLADRDGLDEQVAVALRRRAARHGPAQPGSTVASTPSEIGRE
ncbi:hypothetical protein ASF47_18315 [Nocardioides sp. Leaf285]|nr:hypothetical protein ASF47_18315 [Nocardioides sp. Leaf285]